MKITFLNYFQNINARGAETYVHNLSAGLSLRHSVQIVAAPKSTKTPPADHRLNLLSRLLLTKTDFQLAIWTIKQLSDIRSFRPDAIICLHSGWPAFILRLWSWAHRAKLVIPGQSGPGWYDRLNLLTAPDLFICLTKAQLAWARQAFHFPATKFAVIPNGVDLEVFRPSSTKIHLNLQRPVILAVAASTPAKRLDATIRAVAQLAKASLLIVGSGPLDSRLNQLGSSLLGENRFAHLQAKHSDMPAYYQSADLFTLVSDKSEAFGIVYLEALASNLPVVATKDASRREIVGNAGLLVNDPHQSGHYANKLEAALARRWKNIPRQQAEGFSWDIIVSKYEKVLASL